MTTRLTVRKTLPPQPPCPVKLDRAALNRSALEYIAAALCVVDDAGVKKVFFGPAPPADVSLYWQKTDCAGLPLGTVKRWNGATWV